jgi:hypothetical protein
VGSFLLLAISIYPQCPNNNTLISGAAITPSCPGSTTASCVQGGQYALVNVVAGNTYTFSTCGGANWDTQITLYNNTGGGSLGYNDDGCGTQSTVTWTATFTGQLRVLVDRYNCANNTVCSTLTIQCTPPPTGDCIYVLTMEDSWGDGWGSSNVGVSINGGPWQYYTVSGLTNTISFGVNIGQVVSLSYNNSGPFQGENSFSLSMQGGGPLYVSNTPPQAGIVYTQTVDCVPPPMPPQDCAGGTTICNGQSFNNNSNNTGMVADLNGSNQGCLSSGERQGTWYYFSPSSSGTIGFTIDPAANDDYDFAVWGPMSTIQCPPTGPPIRCSYASGFSTNQQSGSYNTGLGNGATDQTETASGNGWVSNLTVTAGQIYILYIDNFSSTGQAFSLSWQLSNGASLDCTILPIELVSFDARAEGDQVELQWITASEVNTVNFLVERSFDGSHFDRLMEVDAVGDAAGQQQYVATDEDPRYGFNFYRLVEVDVDGTRSESPVRLVNFTAEHHTFPNPTDGLTGFTLGNLIATEYRVTDLPGRTVFEGKIPQDATNLELDLSGLGDGNYFLELSLPNGEKRLVGPIVKW